MKKQILSVRETMLFYFLTPAFVGLPKERDRKALIAYLNSVTSQ